VIGLDKTSRETFAKVAEAAVGWDGKTRPVRPVLSPLLDAACQLQSTVERVEGWLAERRPER